MGLRLGIGKKGFTYLLSVSFILIIVVFVFLSADSRPYQEQQELYEVRARAMNDFVKTINQDLERASFISAFRTMIALEDYIGRRGSFLDDVEEQFRETFIHGTIEGEAIALMNESSIDAYAEKINIVGSAMGISIEFNVSRISLSQPDPWSVDVGMDVEVRISDSPGNTYWDYTKRAEANIPIENLRDPLYAVHTNNRLPNTVRKLDVDYLVSPGNNISNLLEHVNESYYIASDKSPSFLMRFEDDNGASEHGIESIVNIAILSDQDFVVYPGRVKVDYIYFNNLPVSEACSFPSEQLLSDLYFVIPSDRLELYNATGLDPDCS